MTTLHGAITKDFVMKKCQRCGYHEFQSCIEQHHVIYGDNEELINLCCNCHMAVHRRQITFEGGSFRSYRKGDTPPMKPKERCPCGRILYKMRPCVCGRDSRFPTKVTVRLRKIPLNTRKEQKTPFLVKPQRNWDLSDDLKKQLSVAFSSQ